MLPVAHDYDVMIIPMQHRSYRILKQGFLLRGNARVALKSSSVSSGAEQSHA